MGESWAVGGCREDHNDNAGLPDAAVWRSLLASCAHYGTSDMALRMARRLLKLDPNNDSAYVIASMRLQK